MPSMTPGRHSANDGSFGRSVASAGGRGLVLIVVAVLIGALLLRETDSPTIETTQVAEGSPDSTQPGGDPGSTVAGDPGTTGSTLALDPTQTTQPGAQGTVPVDARALNQVRVLVLNGKSGIAGVAKDVTGVLNGFGYTQTLEPGNGPQHQQTAVYNAPGFELDCQRLAQALATARNEQLVTANLSEAITAEVPSALNADCVVVVGKPPVTSST